MGTVYEGIQESIERRVALKVLHPEYARNPDAVTRFFNEARAANRIDHPNIVQVSEFARADDGTVYLVMEFLRGETLGRRLETLLAAGGRMRPVEVVQIAAQLADALAAAHEKGIVHRDLKPGNVMLIPDTLSPSGERVKLLDFGIAKLTQGAGGKATKTNALLGTPQYMSPEQCRGAGGVDERTDVYALGVILYELLAGRPPFVAEEPIAYLGLHVYQPPPPLANLASQAPGEVRELVHRLLEKDKAARPAMREVRARLLQILLQMSGSAAVAAARSEQVPRRELSPSRPASTLGGALGQTVRSLPVRRKVLFAAAILSVLFAGGGLTGVLLRSPSPIVPATVIRPSPPQTELPPSEPVKSARTAELDQTPKPAAALPAIALPTPTKPPAANKPPKPAAPAPSLGRQTVVPLPISAAAPSEADAMHRLLPGSMSQNPSRPRRAEPAAQPAIAPPLLPSRPRKFVD